jgi:pimeloyl-ACP methyl ester carboxylesterase
MQTTRTNAITQAPRARPAHRLALCAAGALALAACEQPADPEPRPSPALAASPATNRAPHDVSPHREGFVHTRGGVRLHYLDWGGTGPALVLLTGLGDNAHVYDDLVPALGARYRVIALTRRGYGQSSRPATGYDVNSLVGDDLAVLDRLGVQRFYLAGHSLGAHEVTRMAAGYPDRVVRAVYLDGSLVDRSRAPGCPGVPADPPEPGDITEAPPPTAVTTRPSRRSRATRAGSRWAGGRPLARPPSGTP